MVYREDLTDAFGGYGQAGNRIFGGQSEGTVSGSTGRDPRGICGSPDPFDLAQGLGNGRGYHGGAGHSRTGEGGRFSLGGFLKDVVIGGIVGGLGSAGFYKAGKVVGAFLGSGFGRGSGIKLDDV